MTETEYKNMLATATEQFKTGVPLFGKNGAFHRILEDFLNAALDAEMDSHLSHDRAEGRRNRRNGKMPKQIQTEYCALDIQTHRDRDGSFTPEIVKKRQTVLAESLSDKILSLYATGQSTRDISAFFEENYGTELSAETISAITDRVLPEIKVWQTRTLDSNYVIVWLDVIHYKVRNDKNITEGRAIYNVIGINKDGYKDLLGMYVDQPEVANFWLQVLTDLNNRGVKDILIACVDGLTRFPDTDVQLCVVHQIHNSTQGDKDQGRVPFGHLSSQTCVSCIS